MDRLKFNWGRGFLKKPRPQLNCFKYLHIFHGELYSFFL